MGVHQPTGPNPVPKIRTTKPISESRRIRKPLMEKKRRERINTCLMDLAAMLTEAQLVKAEPGGKATNKLEKADILELTVKHLKSIKKQTNDFIEEDPPSPIATCTGRYLEGFNKCMGVVDETLSATGKAELREKVLSHLESCKETLVIPDGVKDGVTEESTTPKDTPEDQCRKDASKSHSPPVVDNTVARPTTFTLVPTRLPSGGVAFILQGPNIDTDLLLPKVEASNVVVPVEPATTSSPSSLSCPGDPGYTEGAPPTPVSSPSPPPSSITPPPSLHSSDEEEMDMSDDGDYATDDDEVEEDEVIDVVHITSAGPYDLSTRQMWRPW